MRHLLFLATLDKAETAEPFDLKEKPRQIVAGAFLFDRRINKRCVY